MASCISRTGSQTDSLKLQLSFRQAAYADSTLHLQVALHRASGAGGDEEESSRVGRLSFVDLAGSERANRTGNVGARLKYVSSSCAQCWSTSQVCCFFLYAVLVHVSSILLLLVQCTSTRSLSDDYCNA